MRIVIDLQACQSASRERGIGRYSLALAQSMMRAAGSHEIWLALNGGLVESIEPVRQSFHGLLPKERIAVFASPTPVAEVDPANAWRCRAAEPIREAFLAGLAPDIVHVSSLFEGWIDDPTTSIGLLPSLYRSAVTVYDLIPLLRNDVLASTQARMWYRRKLESLRRADILLAISDYTRGEAIKQLGIGEDRVAVISTAASDDFRPVAITDDRAASLRARFGITTQFVLYAGGFDARKNVESLIAAFASLPPNVRDRFQLVLVGKLDEVGSKALLKLCSGQGLQEHAVVFPGYVPDEDLAALYNLCALFVFPSLHEGFGLPVLEAMACGAAVLGSNLTSIPEVIGRADALFDPTRIDDIAAKVNAALTDESFRADLKVHALRQRARFSWSRSAQLALDAMVDAQDRRRNSVERRPRSGSHRRSPAPKLAYISPLPPERTGIANYSAELLPVLTRHYDIELIVDQAKVELTDDIASLPIRSMDWFDSNAERYDRVIYHIGNSLFHQRMFGMLERHRGVVVLHDFFLGGVLNWMDHCGAAPGIFRRWLYASHGYTGLIADSKLSRHEMIDRFPCNLDVLQLADGIVVHSESARALANQWYGSDGSNWRCVPQLRRIPDHPTRDFARNALELRPEDFLVCCFGFLDPAKLNHRILNAWLASSVSADERFRLVFVGENHGGDYGQQLLRVIRGTPAGRRIHITGYASDETYRHYLASADAAVQLRGVTRGETSRAVLDCFAHGVPLIVNSVGALAELPNDALVRLGDDFKDSDLTEALELLCSNAQTRDRLSTAGRRHVETEHNPDHVAEKLCAAIEQFAVTGPRRRYESVVQAVATIKTVAEPDRHDFLIAAASIGFNESPIAQRQLFVDVSAIVKRDLRTGIERVARSVLKQLIETPPFGFRVEPVYANNGTYAYARRFTCEWLGLGFTSMDDEPIDIRRGDLFFGLDWAADLIPMYRADLERFRALGVTVVFVVHDLLPVLHPEFYPAGIEEMHAVWLHTIAAVSDGIVCISQSVAKELVHWLDSFGPERVMPLNIGFFHLGADIDSSLPTRGMPASSDDLLARIKSRPTALMVGTVEPRKGHAQALAAFESLWRDGTDVGLLIVGKQGWMVDELAARVRQHPEINRRLIWLEDISDEFLSRIYDSASFLLAPSHGEGFGLPIIEAARHALPIIARDIPVFREIAGDNAFYFDGTDPACIADTVKKCVALQAENGSLSDSSRIKWKTWRESVDDLTNVIFGQAWYVKWPRNDEPKAIRVRHVDFARPTFPRSVSFVRGISGPETWGRWSDARIQDEIEIGFREALPLRGSLAITARAFGPNVGKSMALRIDDFKTYVSFAEVDTTVVVPFELPTFAHAITLAPPEPMAPRDLGWSDDSRRLGVGLVRLAITPIV